MAKKTTAQIKKEMAANSAAWHSAPSGSATTKGTKEWYAAQNQTLGKQIGGSYNSASGTWSDSSGNALYSGSGGGTSGGYSGGSSGGSSSTNLNYSPYTQSGYTIGSEYGKQVAQAMGIGTSWTATDGSVWTKENDGTITVSHNGQTTKNAWTPSDLGILGTQQVDANLPASYVQSTMDARVDKALNTPGLEQYAYDATYLMMKNYINAKIKEEEDAAIIEQYKKELAELEQNRPEEYENPYKAEIDALLNQILNRDDFSYDVMNDPLYQQYAQMYQREGDRAMRETLAEAAAGAGGMNSYAITAAQQANNYYNSQLTDKIPELYQLAYDMYINDKENQVQNLGILQNMDDTQYSRYRDTINDFYNDKQFAYGVYQDAIQQGNWQATFDNNNYWANKEFDNTNFWKEKEFNANQGQIDLENSRYDKETAENRLWEFIDRGEMPRDELITQAGWDKADVERLVAAAQAEKAKKGSSSKGGDPDDYNPKGNPTGESNFTTVSNACKELAMQGNGFGAAACAKEALDAGYITQEECNYLLKQYSPMFGWMTFGSQTYGPTQ